MKRNHTESRILRASREAWCSLPPSQVMKKPCTPGHRGYEPFFFTAFWKKNHENNNLITLYFFRNPNLRKKKHVKKKIFDNFLNFASKSSLRVTIWDNLPRWIVYVTLKLPTMHLTNSITFKFNANDYFAKLMQR